MEAEDEALLHPVEDVDEGAVVDVAVALAGVGQPAGRHLAVGLDRDVGGWG